MSSRSESKGHTRAPSRFLNELPDGYWEAAA
jgi:hypothetical protein